MRSWDTAVPALIASVIACLVVPPSGPLSGISDLERHLLRLVWPSLVFAVVLSGVGAAASLSGRHRYSGLFGVLGLLFLNVGALLSGVFGTEGLGQPVPLIVTLPLALVMAVRESAWRSQGVKA
jgi:hypothetical protein